MTIFTQKRNDGGEMPWLDGTHYDPFLKDFVPSDEMRMMEDGSFVRIGPGKKYYERKYGPFIQEYSLEDHKPLPYVHCSYCEKRSPRDNKSHHSDCCINDDFL